MNTSYDCIVIGAGIVGCATALAMQRAGRRTLLLEQHTLNHAHGSSHGGSRITRLAYPSSRPIYTQLMQRSYQMWEELEREVGYTLYRETGLVWIQQKSTGECRAMAAVLDNLGHPGEVLNNVELARRYPFMQYDSSYEALFDKRAGVHYADKCLLAMQSVFISLGGTIMDKTTVTGIRLGYRPVVMTSNCSFECAQLAVCVGGWTQAFAAKFLQLRLDAVMTPTHVTYWHDDTVEQAYSADNGCPTLIVYDGPYCMYGLPSDERPGEFKLCCGFLSGAPVPDAQPVVNHIRRHLKGLRTPTPSEHIECKFTTSTSGHMIVSQHPNYANVAIAGAMNAQGFKLSIAVGEVMSKLLNELPADYNLDDFKIHGEQNIVKAKM